MADPLEYPTTVTFGGFKVEINTSTNGTPDWTAPCGFDTKALNLSAATSEANIPPCNNPDAPGWTARGVSSFSAEVTGSGVMATENAALWSGWFMGGATMPVRVTVSPTEIYEGPAVLTALGNSVALGQNGKLVQRSVTLSSAGPWALNPTS